MNPNRPTDSKVSLDAEIETDNAVTMLTQPYYFYAERKDKTKNMARFYALSIEPTLFGTPCLTRRWGRIGYGGQTKVHHFDREEEAVSLFLALLRERRVRGYETRTAGEHGKDVGIDRVIGGSEASGHADRSIRVA